MRCKKLRGNLRKTFRQLKCPQNRAMVKAQQVLLSCGGRCASARRFEGRYCVVVLKCNFLMAKSSLLGNSTAKCDWLWWPHSVRFLPGSTSRAEMLAARRVFVFLIQVCPSTRLMWEGATLRCCVCAELRIIMGWDVTLMETVHLLYGQYFVFISRLLHFLHLV